MANVPPDPVPAVVEKPGYKTSEFWVMLITVLGSLGVGAYSSGQAGAPVPDGTGAWADQLVHKLTPIVSMIVSLLVSSGYTSRRTELKQTITSMLAGKPAPTPPALPAGGPADTVPISAPAPAPTPAPVAAAPQVPLPSGTFQAAGGSTIRVENGQIVQIGGTPGR